MARTPNVTRGGPPGRRPPQNPRREPPEPPPRFSNGRQVPRGTEQRAALRRRRKRRRAILFYIATFLLVVVAAVTLSLTVLFKIDTIQVTGTSRYPAQQIVQISGIVRGENLFLAKTKEARASIERELPYIKSAKVSRQLPATIVIHVEDDTASGAIAYEGRYALLGSSEKVLEFADTVPEGITLVKGLELAKAEVGKPIVYADDVEENTSSSTAEGDASASAESSTSSSEAASAAITGVSGEESTLHKSKEIFQELRGAIEDSGLDKITEIDLSDRYNLTILYDGRITMELGLPTDLDYKLDYAKGILDTGGIKENEKGTLNLSDAVNNRVPFEPDYSNESASAPG